MQNILNIPTKTKVLLLILVGIVIFMTVLMALYTPKSQEKISIEKSKVTPSQTIIGKKITLDTEKKLDIIKKEASSEGKIIYSLNSKNPIRNDQIITQKEQIIFQRSYIPESPNDPNHLLISRMIEKYGQPERTVPGSKLWGPFMKTYIYSNRGMAFIGNPNTDEVYELQNFTPLSVDEYLQKYGDDIDTTPPGGES